MTENHATIPIKEEMAMRGRIIVRTSVIGIVVNILLAAFKAAVGITANSIAVLLDAVNNLSDALSLVIIAVAVIVKIVLGRYFKRQGQAAESGALDQGAARQRA